MRYDLGVDRIPSAWFNVLPVMPEPLQPPLHPGTNEPIGPDDLAPLFPMGLIAQEVSAEPWIDVPGEVLDILRLWRPTPLVRAERLERALGTSGAHLLQGRVGVAGGVAQAEHRGAAGVLQPGRRRAAPRHRDRRRAVGRRARRSRARSSTSSARSTWCAPPTSRSRTGKMLMETWGARWCRHRSTTPTTPARSGSRSATRCATPRRATTRTTRSGSVLNHVLLHQTVIGLEAKEQLALAGEERPDVVIGELRRWLEPRRHRAAVRGRRRRAARGGRAVVVPDAHRGPLRLRLRRHRGHDAAAADVHARARLRAARRSTPAGSATTATRRSSPRLVQCGRMEAVAYPQGKTFEAAVQFARTEGKVPAPETGHAIRAVIDEALAAKETGRGAGDPLQLLRPRPARPRRPTTTTSTAASSTPERTVLAPPGGALRVPAAPKRWRQPTRA